MSIPDLSPEQEEVFRLIEDTREHVFVTGRAGTGKSTLLQHLAWNTDKQIAVCAPTGVAALNVEGQTIHSLFRLPIGLIADSELEQSEPARRIINAIDTLVIDEISMVNADLMDAIDRSLRQARGRRGEPGPDDGQGAAGAEQDGERGQADDGPVQGHRRGPLGAQLLLDVAPPLADLVAAEGLPEGRQVHRSLLPVTVRTLCGHGSPLLISRRRYVWAASMRRLMVASEQSHARATSSSGCSST